MGSYASDKLLVGGSPDGIQTARFSSRLSYNGQTAQGVHRESLYAMQMLTFLKGWCKMNFLNVLKNRLVFIGFIVAIGLGGSSVNADYTFGTPLNLGPTVNSRWIRTVLYVLPIAWLPRRRHICINPRNDRRSMGCAGEPWVNSQHECL